MSRHRLVETLFLECSALPREEWDAFLDQRCGGDAALKAEILDLLRRDSDADTPSLPPFVEAAGPLLRPDSALRLPETIGPYRILRRLGEGGFGEVFEAEQEHPVRRRVALKVLKAGMDTRAILARFAAERQALALMDHPGVARVFDAGETESGRPYFAMERVDGQPISEWCDRMGASTRTRVELLMSVCRIVEHAHQKGVIHRDLKPSNILVTESDGRPVAKVIDFGIAKAATGVDGGSLHTRPGEFLGTPEYMSPEQAASGGVDVDTRTDVYSLGVVLYQLLTGHLPFPSERLRSLGLDEARRIVIEEEPPRPSDRAGTSRALRGDLDWIVLRAMDKDRSRRYASPASLADDLGRHLREEPVEAGPPTPGYRLRKLVRRRRGAVAAGLVVLLAVTGGVIATALQSVRATRAEEEARRQAETARAVNDFLTGMLGAGNPESNPGGYQVTVREILDRAAADLRDSTFANPGVEAGIREALAGAYTGLGLYREALPHAEQAVAKTEESARSDEPARIRRELTLARLVSLNGDPEAAERRLTGLDSIVSAPGTDFTSRTSYLQIRGGNAGTQGRLAEADSFLSLAADLLRERHRRDGSHVSPLVSTLTNLSEIRGRQRKLDESEALAREALAVTQAARGDTHHDVAVATGHLASVYRRQGRYPAAESLYRAAVEVDRRAVGPQHVFVAYTLSNLGLVLADQGRPREAEAAHREARDIILRSVPGDHPDVITVTSNLAAAIQVQGRLDESLPLAVAVLEMSRRVHGPRHPHTAAQMNNVGSQYRLLHRYEEAGPLFLAADSIFAAAMGPHHLPGIIARYNFGKILLEQGRRREAEPHLREAWGRVRNSLPPGHPNAAIIQGALGIACLGSHKVAEAESLLLGAHATLNGALGPRHERTRDAAQGLAEVYRALGRDADARQWTARAANPASAGR